MFLWLSLSCEGDDEEAVYFDEYEEPHCVETFSIV